MKKTLFALASTLVLISSVVFSSCNGTENTQEDGVLMLRVNKGTITANGIDAATFSVTKDGTDLTKSAEFWQLGTEGTDDIKLTTNSFKTKIKGNYTFVAHYTADGQKLVSNEVSVTVADMPKEVFFRRIFTQQFTSTNCQYCPRLKASLANIAKKPEWDDRMVQAAFHMDFGGIPDPMHMDITTQYMRQYGISGLPYVVLDLMSSTKAISEQPLIEEHLKATLTNYPATCGVSITSAYDQASRKVDFTVKVKASQTNEYRIIAFLIEDGISAPQNGDAATHYNVVRAALSNSLNGDKLGTINADEEVSKTFSKALASNWKAENMRVMVCVLNKVNEAFYGNNSAQCPVSGSIDYKYNEN